MESSNADQNRTKPAHPGCLTYNCRMVLQGRSPGSQSLEPNLDVGNPDHHRYAGQPAPGAILLNYALDNHRHRLTSGILALLCGAKLFSRRHDGLGAGQGPTHPQDANVAHVHCSPGIRISRYAAPDSKTTSTP
ncbi:MAG: hypothetical protein ABIL62_11065 [Planctomycetota bacterium]